MIKIIEKIAGFLFLFIIITNVASGFFGYKTIGEMDSEAKLQQIYGSPTKFKTSLVLILIEHFSIIALAIALFISFSSYNIMLGIIWCIFRIGEALIQIYDKKNYWGLLNIAIKYSDANDTEKNGLIDSGHSILKTKASRFAFAQILFSIGTLSYSILFVTYGVIPVIIGWFGIVSCILYGLGNGIFHIKANFKILWNIGGLLIFIFEIVLGVWLLFF